MHLVALGAARAVAAAQRRLRRDCAAGGKSSGRNLQSKQFEAADDQDHARCARCLLQRAGAAVDAEDASARTPLMYAAAAGAGGDHAESSDDEDAEERERRGERVGASDDDEDDED